MKRRTKLTALQKKILLLLFVQPTQWQSLLPRYSLPGLIGRHLVERRLMEWNNRHRLAITLTPQGKEFASLLHRLATRRREQLAN